MRFWLLSLELNSVQFQGFSNSINWTELERPERINNHKDRHNNQDKIKNKNRWVIKIGGSIAQINPPDRPDLALGT
jgi:hypothetical protein